MYNEWKKIKGYNKLDPKENEGQCHPLLKNLIKSMNYETFNVFPTTIYEIDNHKKYKEDFYRVYNKFDYDQIRK